MSFKLKRKPLSFEGLGCVFAAFYMALWAAGVLISIAIPVCVLYVLYHFAAKHW